MRKSKLPLKRLYTFVSHFLKRVGPNKQAKKKGRPQKYEDSLIITLWLFQILNNYSYRETKMSTFGIHRLDCLMVSKRFPWNAKYETVHRWLAYFISIYTIMDLKS